MTVDRRRLLGIFGVGAAAAGCATAPEPPRAPGAPGTGGTVRFAHGVASGDPDATSVLLWTRISAAEDGQRLRWQVARDLAFGRIAAEGLTDTSRA
ncbi:MAG: PhoD-like phosphatase N-terminal domain-containing protein, partial [Brevundimonas sp.]